MLGTCRQSVLSLDSVLITSVYDYACRLPGRILRRSSAVIVDRHGYSGYLRNVQHYCSHFVHDRIPHRLQSEPPWRTVFFGTDEYAVVHLKALNENRYVVCCLLLLSTQTSLIISLYCNVLTFWLLRLKFCLHLVMLNAIHSGMFTAGESDVVKVTFDALTCYLVNTNGLQTVKSATPTISKTTLVWDLPNVEYLCEH